jgi:hypothetical protein
MSPASKFFVPFLCAFVACPVFIVLHELGHCVAGFWLGARVELHYANTILTIPQGKDTPQTAIFHAGAGPMFSAGLVGVGFLWLYRLRRHRREENPTPSDWLATSLVLNAGRWVVSFIRPRHDEVLVSQSLGLPGWLLPCSLGLLAFIPLVATLRLHPPGTRLLPFTFLCSGGLLGTLVWTKLLGPLVLP